MSINISDIPVRELVTGIRGRYIHTENSTVGFVEIDEGAILPAHSHMHEQTTQVTKGRLEMTIGDETMILEPGSFAVIPSHVPHSARALTDCLVTDTFFPVRTDYQ